MVFAFLPVHHKGHHHHHHFPSSIQSLLLTAGRRHATAPYEYKINHLSFLTIYWNSSHFERREKKRTKIVHKIIEFLLTKEIKKNINRKREKHFEVYLEGVLPFRSQRKLLYFNTYLKSVSTLLNRSSAKVLDRCCKSYVHTLTQHFMNWEQQHLTMEHFP